MSIARFYRNLLDTPEVPAVLQSRMLEWGTQHRDNALLKTLAAHPDLSPEVDDRLADISAARVRAAWLQRPDRDPEVVAAAIRDEKRISVLTGLAQQTDLSPQQYQLLSEREHGAVLYALVTNQAVPFPIREDCLGRWCSKDNQVSYRASYMLLSLLRAEPELQDAYAAHVRHYDTAIQFAASPNLSVATQARLLRDGILTPCLKVSAYRPHPDQALQLAIQLAANPALDPNLVPELLDWLRKDRPDTAPASLAQVSSAIKNLETNRARHGAKGAVSLSGIRSETDPERLHKLALKAREDRDQGLALALARNLAVTGEPLSVVARLLTPGAVRSLVALRSGHPEDAARILVAHPYLLTDDVLQASGQPAEVLQACARGISTLNPSVGLVDQIATSRYLNRSVVLAIPPHVASLAAGPELRVQMAEAICSALGDDEPAWRIFESLAGDFEGSLAELLESCQLVTLDH